MAERKKRRGSQPQSSRPRSTQRRDMWDNEEFIDINSRSDGEPPLREPLGEMRSSRERPTASSSGRRERSSSAKTGREGRKPSASGKRPAQERAKSSRRGTEISSSRREPQRRSGRPGDAPPPPRSRGRPEPAPRKRRKPMGKHKRRFLIVLAVLVMLACTAFLAESLLLRVTNVQVAGDAIYPEEQILSICDYQEGDNLLLIPIRDREEKLQQQLPYVAKAKISRRVPGTVVVEITAARPVCCLQVGGVWYVIGPEGKVLEARADPPAGLLQVTGVTPYAAQPGMRLGVDNEEQSRVFQIIMDTIDGLEAAEDFTRLDLTDLYDIRLWYQDRVECLLGSENELEHKIQYGYGLFDTTKEDAIQADQTGVLDLTYLPESKRAFFNPQQVSPGGQTAPAAPTPEPDTPQTEPEDQTEPEGNEPEEGGEDQPEEENQGGRGDGIPDELYTGE